MDKTFLAFGIISFAGIIMLTLLLQNSITAQVAQQGYDKNYAQERLIYPYFESRAIEGSYYPIKDVSIEALEAEYAQHGKAIYRSRLPSGVPSLQQNCKGLVTRGIISPEFSRDLTYTEVMVVHGTTKNCVDVTKLFGKYCCEERGLET